jgi:DNA-directed RNA polymerase specialized sigma24 family protein
MLGAATIDDECVNKAAGGDRADLSLVMEALQPQVRLMVLARLCPTPAQLDAVDEIVQEVLLGVTSGLSQIKHRTVDGLRAFVSGIVARQVAAFLKKRGTGRELAPACRSLDSTVGSSSNAGPLRQSQRRTP